MRRSVQRKICVIISNLIESVDSDDVLIGVDMNNLDGGFDWSLVAGRVSDQLGPDEVRLADSLSSDELEEVVIEDLLHSLVAIRRKCDKMVARANERLKELRGCQ